MTHDKFESNIQRMVRKALLKAESKEIDTNSKLPSETKGKATATLITAAALISIAAFGLAAWKFHFLKNSIAAPFPTATVISELVESNGIILEPKPGATVGRHFRLVGETRDIDPDKVIVLAVDVDRLRLCWPKKPFIAPNTKFSVDFYEGGPVGEFKVSMYAVDPTYLKNITEWFDKGIFGGMPLFPARYHVASYNLNVNN